MSAQEKYSLQERGRFKAWWDAARPLEGSAFPYEIAWAAWQAALSAQPSPGGQRDDSPMAKMAAALRGKAEAERAAFDQRVQSGEWGPMPDNPDVLELPPLPEEVDSVRCMIRGEKGFAEPCDYYFTSKQMRDYARTALAASQPVSETDAYQQGFRDGQDRTCTVVARQPVGEPVAWLIERLRGKGYGRDKYLVMKGQASSDPDSHLFWTDQQARDNHRVTPLYEWPAQAVDLGLQLDRYDAGLLGEGGGGDVGWWQDYIRTELDRAHEFYQDQADAHG